jgi:hypothetical protein
MPGFSFCQKWLVAVGIIVAGFGVLMVCLSATPLFDLFNQQIDPAFWGTRTVDDAARQFQHWLYGVWGATISGWGVFLTFIALYPFRQKERWAWNCLALGLSIWFILDTGLSLAYGVYFNVVFNVVLALLVGIPILLTRHEFAKAGMTKGRH